MSITVKEALKLKNLKPLKLITGKSGLDKEITRLGILDYEIIEGIIGRFFKGDFVLTTFTPIRNDLKKIKKCIKDLIKSNVTALAIKSIYIKSLPSDIVDFANKNDFPIFLFDENIYFEYIIEDILKGIDSRSNMDLLSLKADILFKKELKKSVISKLAYEINRSFLNEHVTIYFKEKSYTTEENTIHLAERYQRSRLKSLHNSMIKYDEGILLIMSYKKINDKSINLDLKHIIKQMGINKDDFFIGISSYKNNINKLNLSIKESIYTSEACEILSGNIKKYENIGLYKILLPYSNKFWLKDYTESILKPIIDYDSGSLIKTAIIFVEMDGDIKKTSEKLYQHINTIRYRINKIKELMDESKQGSFYEQLSIAIKCQKILDRRL